MAFGPVLSSLLIFIVAIDLIVVKATIVEAFVEELSDPKSTQFVTLAAKVVAVYDAVYRTKYGLLFIRTYVIKFTRASTRMDKTEVEVGVVFKDNTSVKYNWWINYNWSFNYTWWVNHHRRVNRDWWINYNWSFNSNWWVNHHRRVNYDWWINYNWSFNSNWWVNHHRRVNHDWWINYNWSFNYTWWVNHHRRVNHDWWINYNWSFNSNWWVNHHRRVNYDWWINYNWSFNSNWSVDHHRRVNYHFRINYNWRSVGETFTIDLANPSSAAFKSRALLIKTTLEPSYKQGFSSFRTLNVESFSNGSIINHIRLGFASTSVPDNTQIANVLINAASNITAFNIETSSVSVDGTQVSRGVGHKISLISASFLVLMSWLLSSQQ
ncbi:unnamed protein product [Pleuronectes platessa]|uniref:SEA domain-containing protein n=1 Tax=Pleuronectes platessa TaxID=8262 RepID=A0A9N7TU68_PLEPL|nr:unnamed protein product [Pleuronectes platessa]